MKLSTVFELLLIFLIISFAASKYIDSKGGQKWKSLLEKSLHKELRKERQQAAPPNRYCSCSNLTCNCCRDFSLPAVPVITGPGCASLKYLQGDSMLVTMSFGEKVLRNVTISGKKPKPICMSLPGGISKFCGRVYGISRDGDNLRACLGLELRAQDDVEASLRVSCFKLGPKGLNLEPGKPVPTDEDEDDDDDDDDDDDFEFPGDEDDDDDDDDDDDVFGLGDDDENESENAVESGESDYTGFSALSDEFLESFFESDSTDKKKKPIDASANKPAPVVTSKPVLATTVPAKRVKPLRVVTTKMVISTPSKVTERLPTAQNATEKLQIVTEKVHAPSTINVASFITNPPNAEKLVDKVYVSPTQYKPTEKIKPTVNQPLESYVPTMVQLPTEKVYTSPQQLSTDKVYISTISQGTENYGSTVEDKEQPTINYYIPTTQQFLSTERVYIPANLSTAESPESEPVTSTSMTVNVVQSVEEQTKNGVQQKVASQYTAENYVTDMTPDSEYNEVDSDVKTTLNDNRYNEINAASSTTPVRTARPMTTTQRTKQEEDEESLEDVAETAASVFDVEDENTKNKNNTSDEADLEDDLEDSDEDENEGGIVLNAGGNTGSDYVDDDDDDDEYGDDFRKFKGKQVTVSSSSSPKPSAAVHNGREHKRMNLPPLFSQNPEISSFWSSGGHLYKIRMSPMIQEPSTVLQNPSRLGRLNLFVPAVESNPLNGVFAAVQSSTTSTTTTEAATTKKISQHRFSLADLKNHIARISNRNHKRMRLPPLESEASS